MTGKAKALWSDIQNLERRQSENPKLRESLDFKITQLQRQRGSLIALSLEGNSDDAPAKLEALDREILASLRAKAHAEQELPEIGHLILMKKFQLLGELGQQQLKALEKTEALLTNAVLALAKAVQQSGIQDGFTEMKIIGDTLGGTGLRAPYPTVGNMIQEILQKSLQLGISHALSGREVGVDLTEARSTLQALLEEGIPEAEKIEKKDISQRRSSAAYERAELDRFLAATL